MSVVQSTTIQVPEWAVGFVYLLETSDRYQKIGFSHTPWHRHRKFVNLPFAVWLSHVIVAGERTLEGEIHRRFRFKRVRGEWFCLSDHEVAAFKRLSEVKSATALPADFGYTPPQAVLLPGRFQPGRPFKATHRTGVWFRAARNQWYTFIGGRQVPLLVYGRESKELAKQALASLVESLNQSPSEAAG